MQLHKISLQTQKDSLAYLQEERGFRYILSEAVFSKNALLSIGEGTAYSALYGRIPKLLPQIDDVCGIARFDEDENGVMGSRSVQRLREIAVASAVEAIAGRRLKLAEKSRTTMAGQQMDLKLGEMVEIFKKSPYKDRPH